MTVPILDVAVAVLQRDDGRVLLADRPVGKAWAGYWEFPGGKIEGGESVDAALLRELDEELGITPDRDAVRPWILRQYDYPDRRVRLHCRRVLRWSGEPQGREGQRLAWENPAAPVLVPPLPTNQPILDALAWPACYAITCAGKLGVDEFLTRLDNALMRGLRLIQVREPDFTDDALIAFTREVVARARPCGARVLVNDAPEVMVAAAADGVHLPARRFMAMTAAPDGPLWAASCHDGVELGHAAKLGAAFAVLSPVLPTPTHPEAAGIGWARFGALAADSPIPVYALGGMKPALLDTAQRHGAHGIALLSGAWT